MTTSSAYFATIRPAPGFIIPESHLAIEEYLTKTCKSAIMAVEKEGHQTHIHFCFITNEPRRKDSVMRSIKTIVSKFYLNSQINLKIALTEGAYFYTIKDGNVVFRYNEEDIINYIEKDFERSQMVIEENTEFKNTVLRYSYSNRATWQPFFNNLKKSHRTMTLEQWKTYVFIRQGKLAATEFMWDLYYKQYINHSNGVSQKVLETFQIYEKGTNQTVYYSDTEEDEPPIKRQKVKYDEEYETDESGSDCNDWE